MKVRAKRAGGLEPTLAVARDVLRSLPDVSLLLFDANLRFVFCDGSSLRRRGYTPAQMEGRTVREVLGARAEMLEPMYQRALAGETLAFEAVSGDRRFSVRAAPTRDAAGAIVGGSLLSIDVTDQPRAARTVHESLERLDRIASNVPGRVSQLHVDADGTTRWVNVASRPQPRAEDGSTTPDGVAIDVTELNLARETARWNLEHDALTGLPNRALYFDRLGQALVHARGRDESVGVCFVDFDRFKQVNDTFGHAVGDEVLRTLALRIQAALRPQDTVARHGSDELKVLLAALPDRERAADLAHRIEETCREPILVGTRELVVSCSVGVAVAPDDGLNAELLLSRADTAMHRAKELGRSRVETYDRDLARRGEARLRLQRRLRAAIAARDFHLVYQPQVDANGMHRSVEALLRWHPQGRDAVPPDEFIPLAEELGLIGAIGAWVLREACRATAVLHVRGSPVRVCVNLSPNQLADPGLSSLVAEALADARLPPELLELELTETALMEPDEDASARLGELRTLGVRISLDDFGTGYSSLARLQQLPLDALKIDRSFIARIGHGSGTAIVGSIIELGHTLGLEVIAEGIETSEQRAIVQSLGIDRMQGYLIGRPTVELRPPSILGAV
jgi:diguanylate cyclase (GGDEF)-like protein